MSKKSIIMCVCIALCSVMAMSSTLAYLTSTDSDVNVMTLGNVKIEQVEEQWNEDGSELEDFDQDKPLLPAVGELGWAGGVKDTDAFTKQQKAYRQFTMNNVVDKYVSVKNTGTSDAYVRTLIAFEMGSLDENEWKAVIGSSKNAEVGKEFAFPGAWVWDDGQIIEIGGQNYFVYTITHQDALKKGEQSIPSLLQVYMKSTADNAEVEALDGNNNGKYDILVVSQAVQAAGFEDAETALETSFYKVSKDNHPWMGQSAYPVSVSTSEELEAALAQDVENIYVTLDADVSLDISAHVASYYKGGESTKSVTIVGNGHTLNLVHKNTDWNYLRLVNDDAKLTLTDVKLTNSGANDGPWNRHDIRFYNEVELNNVTSDKAIALLNDGKLNNVTITETGAVYGLWISADGQTVNVDGLNITSERAIKIADEYVDAPAKVTLNLKNAEFTTTKKAAILVTSTAGADINLTNVDISGCAADTVNAVWNDEERAEHFSKITVTGGTAAQE